MGPFISFSGSEDEGLLVEVTAEDFARAPEDAGASDGLVETGYTRRVREGVAVTMVGLREALERTVTASGQSMVEAAQAISPAPDEVEVTFGINATGEVGNVAVARGSGAANFTVRLKWSLPPPG